MGREWRFRLAERRDRESPCTDRSKSTASARSPAVTQEPRQPLKSGSKSVRTTSSDPPHCRSEKSAARPGGTSIAAYAASEKSRNPLYVVLPSRTTTWIQRGSSTLTPFATVLLYCPLCSASPSSPPDGAWIATRQASAGIPFLSP